ncbi:MAG: hypothetical protein M3P18_26000 [Actinomycetota bacterium]|nr:hypothetical protein [Actinomycetota bacterium]
MKSVPALSVTFVASSSGSRPTEMRCSRRSCPDQGPTSLATLIAMADTDTTVRLRLLRAIGGRRPRMNEPTPRELGEYGLEEALGRLRERVSARANPTAVLVSLGEALGWLYALEEFHTGRDSHAFYAGRAGDPGGETEAGLIYARGLFTHGLNPSGELSLRSWAETPFTQLRRASSGGQIVLIRPMILPDYLWKPLAELPPPGEAERHGRDRFYETHVQGYPLLQPLEIAARWITTLP